MTNPTDNDPSAAPPATWNLNDLFHGPDDPRIEETLERVKQGAEAFAAKYRGRIAALALSAPELARSLAEYERLYQDVAYVSVYVSLRFAADTAAPENGALLQKVRERTTEATLPLIFFNLEIMDAPEEGFAALLADDALAPYRHYLQNVRSRAPFRLSEAEERVLEEQANTGKRAFVRLYEEVTSSMRFTVEGHERPLSLSETLDLQHDANREVRRASSEAVSAGLEPHARTLSFIFNTLLQDKATDDRLRGYAYQEQARHLSNELEPETVETVVQTAVEGYGLVARYYEAKRRWLGLSELTHYDRYAPVLNDEAEVPFEAARDLVIGAFTHFDKGYAAAAKAFFDGNWIDAPPRPGKRGGAFCSSVTPDTHPYIFLNYLGKPGDVKTLAHELGHGIHAFVSRGQSYLNFYGTLPMAEVASTFAEMLLFETQQEKTTDERTRLGIYAHQVEQAIATIFRQAALYRYEQAIHHERRTAGELRVERFGELWQENVGAMFGRSVTLEPGHALWWSYIRHFIATPFYVYAYTFGEMLAFALYHRYKSEGAGGGDFAERFIAMLAAGGSKSPQELVAPLGVNLSDASFWRGALEVLEAQVAEFERLAEKLGGGDPAKDAGSSPKDAAR